MTLKQFTEFVAESSNREWLQSYNLNVKFPLINYSVHFKSAIEIYEFVVNQSDGFAQFENLPREFEQIKQKFIQLKANILQLLSNGDFYKGSWDDILSWLTNNNSKIFLSESPETNFLLNIYKSKTEFYNGAYEYLTGGTTRPSQKEFLDGYILAWEFKSKDVSKISERIEAERMSITTISSNFQEKLGAAEKEVADYIFKSNEKFKEYSLQIDNLKKGKEKVFNDWFTKSSNDFNTFNESSTNRIVELENLYREKLKLEAPATYWRERAVMLRREGFRWLLATISFSVIAVAVLIWILVEISNGKIEQVFHNTGIAIKWSLASIALISFLAVAIKIFSKLTFSAYHLVRDAEEREQLTYVYLALQKESGIDKNERHLIMQSLFSRADTGLLKEDSSPTMPGNVMEQIIKKV